MEDLADILKRHYCGLYKKKDEAFGTVQERVTKMNEKRKINRHDTAFERRKIPANMTPIATPAPTRERTQQNDQPVNKRLEMLAKWKADKEKRKENQKKTLKPIFKVAHISVSVGLPNLENVNAEIKGKRFKSKFAPANHKFKPPANIKPINLDSTNVNNSLNRTKITSKQKNEEATVKHRMVTRSQAHATPLASKDKVDKSAAKSKKASSKTKTIKQPDSSENKENDIDLQSRQIISDTVETLNVSLLSPDYPVENNNASESDDVKTPQKKDPPPYISPFVTISRGRDSARKEFEARKSNKSFSSKPDTPEYTSPKAGAAYFTWLVDNQTARLQELCEQWTKYKDANDPPEEAVSMIDVAIGQTNLLITKKFVQFHGLIDRCKDEDGETLITCEDLHGFWDMMHLQVKNLDKRFDNLDKLKANDWKEILPEVTKGVVKKRGRPVKNVKATAGLKAAIEAARRRNQSENRGLQDLPVERKTPQNRRSSGRLGIVKSTEHNHRNSSPGLMMMKVAQYAKGVETPGKSILKTDGSKSAKSQSKTVFFQDELLEHIEDVENDLNNSNLQSKVKTPVRRSRRLTQSKLF